MITYLVKSDNSIVRTNPTNSRVMQRSKLVDTIHFLVPQMYNEYDMSLFTVSMEYISPVSKTYRTEILAMNNSGYENGYELEYILPADTNITAEAGNIEMSLTFLMVELDDNKNIVNQYVRKTEPCYLTVHAITEYSNILPDDVLSPLDQRLVALLGAEGGLEAINKLVAQLEADKVKDISIDTEAKNLHLTGNGGNQIGTGVDIDQISGLTSVYMTGADPDGNADGVINLDVAKTINI